MKLSSNQCENVLDTVAAYDALAPFYRRISDVRSQYLEEVERIIVAHAHGASSFLDLGAGDGVRTLRIAQSAEIPHVIALEPSAKMRARFPRELSWLACRVSEIPPSHLTFDLITCLWNVLGHMQDHRERVLSLTKARELLSPAGMLFVDVNHRYNAAIYGWAKTAWRILYDDFFWSEKNGDALVTWIAGGQTVCTRGHLFTRREIENLCREAGLVIRDTWVVNYKTGNACAHPFWGNLLYRLSLA